ncbi:MAG: FG-GAP-like repeat-containing protein, partial [Bacteroidota bacterium]
NLDLYVANYLRTEDPLEGGQPNFFYRNDGNFRFTEQAAALGLDDTGCGLGAAFLDYDNDGAADIYLANDYGYSIAPNELFRNGGGTFAKTAAANGTAATINAMGIAKGDYDNDGDTDLYVTNIRENPLFANERAGSFFQFRSESAGVALPEYTSWGTSFADFDLDGWEDLIIANGQIAEVDNQPEPMTYFRNRGDGTFADASAESGLAEQLLMGRGLAVADYDLDGLPDVAVQAVQADFTGDQVARLLRNGGATTGNWLEVATPAGALRLELHAGGRAFLREIDGGSSYLSQAAVPVHFGWPAGSPVDSLVVTFTGGEQRAFSGLPVNSLVALRSDGSWMRIQHQNRTTCGAEAILPTVAITEGETELLVQRTETQPYGQLEDLTVDLAYGEIFRDLARTQDAVLVDTIPQATGCPSLQTVRLRIQPPAEVRTMYPNPTNGTLWLELTAAGGPLTVTVFSLAGKRCWHREYDLGAGEAAQMISLDALPIGNYVCRVVYAGTTTYHKVVRQ